MRKYEKNVTKDETWNKWTTVSIIGILIGLVLICFFSSLSIICVYLGIGIFVISLIIGIAFGNMGRGTSGSEDSDSITINGKTYIRKK